MYSPNPRYPPSSSSITPLWGVYLLYLSRVVGAAPKTQRGGGMVEGKARRKGVGEGREEERGRGEEEEEEEEEGERKRSA